MGRDPQRPYHRALRQRLTYPEAGATLGGPLPAGYTHLRRRVRLGTGADVFRRAGAYVLVWGAQRGAGFEVYPGTPPEAGATVLVLAGVPPLPLPRLVAPCRVIETVAERNRTGFAYGTLPGHPECGEEAFMVVRDEGHQENTVWFEVTAFSRPGAWYTHLAGPAGRLLQGVAVRRYLRAVSTAVGGR
jgi:uncharacterized protein (UPF0548 family)